MKDSTFEIIVISEISILSIVLWVFVSIWVALGFALLFGSLYAYLRSDRK